MGNCCVYKMHNICQIKLKKKLLTSFVMDTFVERVMNMFVFNQKYDLFFVSKMNREFH